MKGQLSMLIKYFLELLMLISAEIERNYCDKGSNIMRKCETATKIYQIKQVQT